MSTSCHAGHDAIAARTESRDHHRGSPGTTPSLQGKQGPGDCSFDGFSSNGTTVSNRPGRLSVAQKCASSTSCKDARASLMPKGAYISQVAQRIIDNLLPCIDDRRVEHRVLVQGRLGALHKADLEPIICSLMVALMVAKISESRTLEHRQSLWISRTKVPSDSNES